MTSTISTVKGASLKTWSGSSRAAFRSAQAFAGQSVLFDEVDDFRQADGRDDHPTSGCGGLIDEVSGCDGQTRVIEEIPEGSMRIRDACDH